MRNALILLTLILLGAGAPALAQRDNNPSFSPEGKTITSIEVKGNKAISTNIIISKMKSRIGSVYQENIASDDLKRLYLLGFFSDVKMDTQPYKDGAKILVLVSERPIIKKISFKGIQRITMKDDKLKSLLKSKEGQYLDYPNLSEDVRTLDKMYERIGYSQVDISYDVKVDKETNKADVEFVVVEGRRIHIKNIYIKGNKAFSSGKIIRLLKTKRGWLFNAGILKEDVLQEDLERIKAFYRRNGYTDITARSEVSRDEKKPQLLYVTITVEEGRKYLVGSITVQGNKEIAEKNILSKLSVCLPGKVYSEEGIKRDISNIHGVYFDRGYISAQVQESTVLNPQTGRVDITYNVIENQVTYVDKIKVKGNIKTRDLVIRRELRIHPGDKFDGEKLRRSKERLQNLGYFEDVSYDTEDTPAPDRKDLVVDVKESKTGAFSFGGGYSTVDEFVGFVEIEQRNFDWRNFPYFTGGGQDLKLRASFGSLTQYFDLSFTQPWIFDYPLSFGFDIYRRTHKRDSDVGYGYDEKVTGGDVRLSKDLTEYIKGDLIYRLDEIDISDIADDASNDLRQEYGKNTISSVTLGLTYDSRDNVFDTRKGDVLSVSVQGAGGGLGGDKDFYKVMGRASHFFPMPRSSVLEVRGRVGIVDPYDDTVRVPIYERFFAGGSSTIRGYEERKIGPIDSTSKDPLGGESMIVGNIEYTYPFFGFLKGAVFYDTGNVWSKMKDMGKDKFYSSFGLGLRIKTPLGPINLDYGIPLDKEPGEDSKKSGRFHFSASHGF